MTVSHVESAEDDDAVDSLIDEERPVVAEQVASDVLERAARARGLEVHRHDTDLIVCQDRRDRVAFRGFAGSASSKVAHFLCGNDLWLRRHLEGRGIPVLPTQVADTVDPDFARRQAELLGYPVSLRLMDEFRSASHGVVHDSVAFDKAWRQRKEMSVEQRAQVIVERASAGQVEELAVVGDRIVATHIVEGEEGSDLKDHQLEDLAIRVIASLPNAGYGSVRVVADSSGHGFMVSTVDLAFHDWVHRENPELSKIAEAILAFEFLPQVES